MGAALWAAGCGGGGGATSASTTVLTSAPEQVSIGQVQQAIAGLYRAHPGVRSYVVRDVQYTPRSRDKVLSVCRQGGPEANAVSLESAKVLACAPLIFFYWSYGKQSSVPASSDVARKLYWFAATSIHGPFAARPALDKLLQRWGVD